MNYLFLIGLNKYEHLAHLNKCINDITAFREILLEKFEFEESEIYELTNEKASYLNVTNQFRNYNSLQDQDNLIIYFSGHGGLFDKNLQEGYWALYDTDSEKTGLSFNDIVKLISNINCRHLIIISDSCYSRSLLNAQVNVIKKINPEVKRSREPNYENLKSRYVITTGSLETFEGGDESQTSIFNEKLIHYLKEADKNFRITELSEYLKKQFENNILQKPQSSFINDHNNQYGEFLFKIAEDYNSPNSEFQGFADFQTLITQIAPNLIFVKSDNYSDNLNKVGFEILTMLDEDSKRTIYYLYLFQGINQKRTVKYIREKFPIILNDNRDRVVFLPKENQKNPEIRKNNIQNKFQAKSTYYIDEYLSKRTIRNSRYTEPYISYAPKNFVTPIIESSNQQLEKNITSWFNNTDKPILVIKGEGGIGKTTLSGFCSDYFFTQNKEIRSSTFIECKRIRGELIKLFNAKRSLNLYDLYEAYFNNESRSKFKLTYELFRINIDSGNLLLILDGLDELISHVQNFEVEDFLNSIIDIKREFKKSKIIITCRSYFWNKANISSELFESIIVNPFNENQVNDFFSRYFLKDDRKIENCKKLSQNFYSINSNNEKVYLPYVLDVIRTIIESNYEVLDNILDEKSEYLNLELKKDYVIYRACNREKEKLNDLSIDNQVRFFIHLAIYKRGIINIDSIGNELMQVFDKHFDSSQVESFKSHILLKIDGQKLLFRYDFFGDLFKTIFFSHLLKKDITNHFDENLIELISESFWFNSGVLIDIVERINSYPTQLQLEILNLYEGILKQNKNINEQYKILSSLFNLLLRLNHKFKGNNISRNTEMVVEFFQENNTIEFLSIMDIYNDDEIRFDFSGKILKNCNFNNYRSFWNCVYDSKTRFENCSFFNLNYAKLDKVININVDNILNPTCDDDFRLFLKQNPLYHTSIDEDKKEFLKGFLKIFVRSNNVIVITDDRIKSNPSDDLHNSLTYSFNKMKSKYLELDDMLSIAEDLDIVVPFDNRNNKGNKLHKIMISSKYKNDIISYVTTNTPSKIIIDYYKRIK